MSNVKLRRSAPWTLLLCTVLLAIGAVAARGAVVSNAGDATRTGWYPDQPRLAPTNVGAADFGQLFSTPVTGQVYGQPLVANNTLFVATEANRLYGLDPVTGAQRWTRTLGTPFNASDVPGGGCSDLTPTIGVTGTPAIDTATSTAYFFSKTYATGTSGPGAWFAHAVDITSGAERSGFPVRIQGPAQNNSSTTFNASTQMQRPGVLLMNGVVYAGFGSHCDHTPWQGWVVGVSTAGQLGTMWTSMGVGANENGAGIWQSGGGLMSDGPGQIVVTTGNPGAPSSPSPGSTPPRDLGEAVVRLAVQADGTLRATDFFAPYDAATLDTWDADFGSGGPMALPDSFGTSARPHLMVAVGKQGYVYLLDRDALGGIGQGPGGSDKVVDRKGPYGGVWSRPSAWPGDGGYVYIPTASGGDSAGGSTGFLRVYRVGVDASGTPRLSLAATSSDAWGFGTSSPIVTSNGTQSGTALMWVVWSPNGSGVGAQLRAYDAVPSNGVPVLRKSFPVGTAAKFTPPGVAGNRVYVGTRDGRVLGFGAPISTPLTAAPSALSFPTTTIGAASTNDVVITANQDLTVTGLSNTNSQFTLAAPALPATLRTGDTLRVPVTFKPAFSGPQAGQLSVTSSAGTLAVALSGTGQPPGPQLSATPPVVSFGGTATGRTLTSSVTFSNTGGQSLTVTAQHTPSAPFAASGLPAAGSTLAPGQSVTSTVTFSPTAEGQFTTQVGLDTTGGTVDVGLSGSAAAPPKLSVTPRSLDYGSVVVGQSVSKSFAVKNTGGSKLTITRSKPPLTGSFGATTSLDEGTTLAPGETKTETVRLSPTATGAASATWAINSDDSGAAQDVTFTGTGVDIPDPTVGGWALNGTAGLTSSGVQLTGTAVNEAGTAFWPTAVDSADLKVAWDANIDSGSGADGLALVLGDPGRGATPTMVGAAGGGLAFSGIPGWAVALDTYQNEVNPSANFVGLSDGPVAGRSDELRWLATATGVPALRGATRHVEATYTGGALSVTVDGQSVLSKAVTLPSKVLVGFSGAQGELTDRHFISRVTVTRVTPPPPPPPPPTPASLKISMRVVAPSGSAQLAQKLTYRGTCPSAFTTGPLASGSSTSPALTGAVQGSTCSVTQSLPTGTGWTTQVSVNGGTARTLAPTSTGTPVPSFALLAGVSTVAFTNTYSAARTASVAARRHAPRRPAQRLRARPRHRARPQRHRARPRRHRARTHRHLAPARRHRAHR